MLSRLPAVSVFYHTLVAGGSAFRISRIMNGHMLTLSTYAMRKRAGRLGRDRAAFFAVHSSPGLATRTSSDYHPMPDSTWVAATIRSQLIGRRQCLPVLLSLRRMRSQGLNSPHFDIAWADLSSIFHLARSESSFMGIHEHFEYISPPCGLVCSHATKQRRA